MRQIHARRQLEFIANIACIFDENGAMRKAELGNVAYADDPEYLGEFLNVISRKR